MENTQKKKIHLKDIYPDIKENIDNGGTIRLPITGISMRPLLICGRDTVDIVKCKNPQKGDIIFYLRDNGQFVLHRIVGMDEKGYILCGDNQWTLEHGIQDRHIIGVVNSITRKGKTFQMNNVPYRMYSSFWMGILPIRKIFLPVIRKTKTLVYNICVKIGIIKK